MELLKQGKRLWPDEATLARAIMPPPVQQGIGEALRAAYVPRAYEVPKELAALLAKLG